MTEVLSAAHITKSYGERTIIRDINVHLNEQEIVCLLGVSGVGKTTLFHILSGLSRPDSGSVMLNGREITGQPGKISYMLQKDLLLPYKRIIDNVALPLTIRGMKKQKAREKAAAYFEQFGLSGTEFEYPAQLSGGMRQRAALLRTYLSSEGVALLDEPFSALDTITKSAIHDWYLDIMQKISLSTLFITHDIDEAIVLSDRIYILSGSPGQITAEIEIEEKRPRARDFSLTPAFLSYKKQIVSALGPGSFRIQEKDDGLEMK